MCKRTSFSGASLQPNVKATPKHGIANSTDLVKSDKCPSEYVHNAFEMEQLWDDRLKHTCTCV